MKRYYREQTLEAIARKVLCDFDPSLYYGPPAAIPIEYIIEAHHLSLEYQYLRKNGSVLGMTIFNDGLEIVYDKDEHKYMLYPVKAGTILIDASLCEEESETGRLRFTYAHELAHWLLHKDLYLRSGENAAMMAAAESSYMEVQANKLGSCLLMPLAQIKRCFYQLRPRSEGSALIEDMARIFQVSQTAMRIRLADHNLL